MGVLKYEFQCTKRISALVIFLRIFLLTFKES